MKRILLRLFYFFLLLYFFQLLLFSHLIYTENFKKNLIYLINKVPGFFIRDLQVDSLDSFSFKEPKLHLFSENLNLDLQSDFLKIKVFQWSISLQKRNFVVDFFCDSSSIQCEYDKKKYSFEDVKFDLVYDKGSLLVKNLSLKWNNILINVKGNFFDEPENSKELLAKKEIKSKKIQSFLSDKNLNKVFSFLDKIGSLFSVGQAVVDVDFLIRGNQLKELKASLNMQDLRLKNLPIKSAKAEIIYKDGRLTFLPIMSIIFNNQESINLTLSRNKEGLFEGEFRARIHPLNFLSNWADLTHFKKIFINKNKPVIFLGTLKDIDFNKIANFSNFDINHILIENGVVQAHDFYINNLKFNWSSLAFSFKNKIFSLKDIYLHSDDMDLNLNAEIDLNKEEILLDIKKIKGDVVRFSNFLPKKIQAFYIKIWKDFKFSVKNSSSFQGRFFTKFNGDDFYARGNLYLVETSFKKVKFENLSSNLYITQDTIEFKELYGVKGDNKFLADLSFIKSNLGSWHLDFFIKEMNFPFRQFLNVIDEDLAKKTQQFFFQDTFVKLKGKFSFDKPLKESFFNGEVFFSKINFWDKVPLKNILASFSLIEGEVFVISKGSKLYEGNFNFYSSYNIENKLLWVESNFSGVKLALLPLEKNIKNGNLRGNVYLLYDYLENKRLGEGVLKIDEASIWSIPVISNLLFPFKEYLPSIDKVNIPFIISKERITIKNAQTNGKLVSVALNGYINDFTKDIDIDIKVNFFGSWLGKLFSPLSYFLADSRIYGKLDDYLWKTKRFFFFDRIFKYREKNGKLKFIY